MRAFGWTPDFARKGMPGAQSWAYFYWALENELTMFGAAFERKGDGYVAMERKRILKLKQNGRG